MLSEGSLYLERLENDAITAKSQWRVRSPYAARCHEAVHRKARKHAPGGGIGPLFFCPRP